MASSPYRRPTQSAPVGLVAERYPRDGMFEVTLYRPAGAEVVNGGRFEFVDAVIPPVVRTRMLVAMQRELLAAEAEGLMPGGEPHPSGPRLVP